MKTFVTSDLHFGHANIIRHCERPFDNADEMNASLIERWNSVVSNEDAVLFLGDFAMGPGVDDSFIETTISQLHGHISFLLGNHDMPSKKYGVSGIAKIATDLGHTLLPDRYDFRYDGKRFIAGHYPISDWDGKYRGVIHLHGHSHSRMTTVQRPMKTVSRLDNGRYVMHNEDVKPMNGRYDVGIDLHGKPVELTGDCRFLADPQGW